MWIIIGVVVMALVVVLLFVAAVRVVYSNSEFP